MPAAPADPSPTIHLRDVHVTLRSAAGPVKILRGIDLSVAAGSAVSVVGPSGSGKSTLLAVVGGIERPTSGAVEVDGQDLGALDEDRLAAFRGRRIGILFQAFHLIPTMSALENVAVPLELAGAKDALAQAERRLAEVGLSARATHYPGQLSGGEQQRVALARALANRPKLLLADEPTGNLDQETGREIVELLFRVQRERSTTLLLITHEPALAARCGQHFHMADGRLYEVPAAERRVRAVGADEVA
ncbi:MAG: ABC transporter ATP-binding protein [Geminicoccaceae bacterium]